MRLTHAGELFLDKDGQPSYHGPGHGDVLSCVAQSGLLTRFTEMGGKHLLLSNVDNVLATIDPQIYGCHLSQPQAVTVELVDRLAGDQGGGPYRLDGRLQIIEGFRLPKSRPTSEVPVFNTNTFWLDAEVFSSDVQLTWFAVNKTVDGEAVVQFERLVGEVTSFFDSQFVRVPRGGVHSRFIPVKTPEDLETARPLLARALEARL